MQPKAMDFARFGGLELRNDPQEFGAGAAVDMRNIVFDSPGVMKTRDGHDLVNTVGVGGDIIQGIFAWPQPKLPNDYLVIATFGDTFVYDTAGALRGSTSLASIYSDFEPYGTANNEGYLALGSTAIKKITHAGVLSSPAGMPTGSFLAVQAPDSRLVVGDPTVTGGSRVRFSDAGAPETFGVNNWVDVEPAVADNLTSVVSWNNLVFVFKSNKFFVFYGNDVSASGTPIFNYRRVSDSLGAVAMTGSLRNAVVGDDGVYFLHRSGIYKTTGSTPQKISGALDPLFRGWATSPYYTGVTGSAFGASGASGTFEGGLVRIGNRLILKTVVYDGAVLPAIPAVISTDWFVYDMELDLWTYWRMPWTGALSVAAVGNDNGVRTERMYSCTGRSFLRMTPNAVTDNGTSISASYRTGFWRPGDPGAESWVRETILEGTGTVTVKKAVNDAVTLGTGQAVTLGTAPAIGQGRDRRAVRARNISYEFSGTAPWSLSSVVPVVWGQRQTSEQA